MIVRVSPGSASTVDANYQLNVVRNLDHDGNVQLVSFPDAPTQAAFSAASANDSLILSSENDQLGALNESDNDSLAASSLVATTVDPLVPGDPTLMPYFGTMVRTGYVQQPNALLINIAQAQQTYGAGSGVVAIIDTGVDATHPVLQNVFVSGYDFLTGTAGIPSDLSVLDQSTVALLDQVSQPVVSSTLPMVLNQSTVALLDQSTVALLDQSTVALLDSTTLPKAFGHGTMISGLIHLVAPNVQIMPLRAFQPDGTANLSDIVNAIYYAANNGARVINMSFSSSSSSPALYAAVQYALSQNVICVAAAGNQGQELRVYPAAIPGVIGVGSTNGTDLRSMFSNYGHDTVRTAAPGEALITSYPDGNYAGVWGTSFSSALVSGAVALGVSVNPATDTWDVRQAVRNGHFIPIEDLGDVRLDVPSLVQAISQIQ